MFASATKLAVLARVLPTGPLGVKSIVYWDCLDGDCLKQALKVGPLGILCLAVSWALRCSARVEAVASVAAFARQEVFSLQCIYAGRKSKRGLPVQLCMVVQHVAWCSANQ